MSVKKKISKRNYLKGKQLLQEAKLCVNRGLVLSMLPEDIHGCIEAFQHAFELSLKALYQLHGLSFPESHNAAKSIHKISKRMKELPILMDYPVWEKREKWIIEKSEYMAKLHHLTIYGDEDRDIPASQLFTQEEKGKIITDVGMLFTFVRHPMLLIGYDLDLLSGEEENELKNWIEQAVKTIDPKKLSELKKRVNKALGDYYTMREK